MILTSKTGGRRPTEKNRGGRVDSLRRFYHRELGHVVAPRGTLADNRLYAWTENIRVFRFSLATLVQERASPCWWYKGDVG